MQKKENLNTLAELNKLVNDLAEAHHHNYRNLLKYGPNMFEQDGFVLTEDDAGEYKKPGRDFILKTIRYFEQKDEPHFYRMCARLTIVLNDYDRRFTLGIVDNKKGG